MKTNLLLLTCLLFAVGLHAQAPTLNGSTTNPVTGEVSNRYLCDTTGITDSLTGPGVVWNYAGLTVANYFGNDTCEKLMFESCSPTPYCSNFTGTTLADEIIGFNEGTGATDTTFEYFVLSASVYSILGTQSATQLTSFSPNEVLLNYPFTYSTVQTNTFNTINYQYLVDTIYSASIDTFIGDGYGTVILPTGTFDNVLRIHAIYHRTDTVYHNGRATYGNHISDQYLWFSSDYHQRILSMYNYPGDRTPWQITFDTQFPLSANSINATQKVPVAFPNPANDLLHISGIKGGYNYTISNIQGYCLLSGIWNEAGGGVDITTLAKGLYILRLVDEAGNQTIQKVVKE